MIVVYETAADAQNALNKNGDDFGPFLLDTVKDDLLPTDDLDWKYERGLPYDERFKPGKTRMTTQAKGFYTEISYQSRAKGSSYFSRLYVLLEKFLFFEIKTQT